MIEVVMVQIKLLYTILYILSHDFLNFYLIFNGLYHACSLKYMDESGLELRH